MSKKRKPKEEAWETPVEGKCIECGKNLDKNKNRGMCDACLEDIAKHPEKWLFKYKLIWLTAKLVQKIQSSRKLNQICRYADRLFRYYMGFQRFTIHIYNEECNLLEGIATYPATTQKYKRSMMIHMDQILPEWGYRNKVKTAFCTGKTIIVNDRRKDPDYVEKYYLPKMRGEKPIKTYARAFMCVPLHTKKHTIGVLTVFRMDTIDFQAIDKNDLLAVKMIAKQLTQALENFFRVRKWEYRAVRDSLTFLYNRKYLHEVLKKEIERADNEQDCVTLFMLDIDFFKNFNDTYGHLEGDKILMKIAQLLTSSVRKTDVVARYGGEEFSVVLPGTSLQKGIAIAERLRKRVETRLKNLKITISIGVATRTPEDKINYEQLIARADKCLYQAKRAGRNTVRYYEKKIWGG